MGVAVQDALAATLADEGSRFLNGVASIEPLSVDVWLEGLRSYGTLPTGGVPTNDGIAFDGVAVGPAVPIPIELESSPVLTEAVHPYPGSGRLNTLAHE